MPGRPVLDDLELELVQKIDSEQDEELVRSAVPGLDGDFLASVGRRATRFTLTGVVIGEEAGDSLKKLREKFASADPVSFVSDIATATQVDKVVIEEMGVRELAGRPERFEYSFTLREFKAPEPPTDIIVPPPPPPPPAIHTCLEVTVIVADDPNFDFSTIRVSLTGTTAAGASFSKQLTNRNGNVWTEDDTPPGNMPPGTYTVTASTEQPEPMTGTATVTVEENVCPNAVTITLRRGVRLGNTYVVHYRFDKSFVEPCLRAVLKEVADRASTGPADEKVLIVGHTDLTGPDQYNQSLSERRARGVYAFLTYAANSAVAVEEWNNLRRAQTGGLPTINDNWTIRQAQYMLQDLNFYNAEVDGINGDTTIAGIRHFQQVHTLPDTGAMDDATWPVLIDEYMKQDSFNVPPARFLKNCDPETLKWIGCGEKDPVLDTQAAWRPDRRTEILFTRSSTLACKVPQPDTFNLPAPGSVNANWCLGPGDPNNHICFLTRPNPKDPQKRDPNALQVQPANPAQMRVAGRIRHEDGSPAVGVQFVLIAPDGEYMKGEQASGEPRFDITNSNGEFHYDRDKGVGVWILEIHASVLARLEEDPPSKAKGNVVCKRMDGSTPFNVIITSRPSSFEIVDANDVNTTLDRVVFGQRFLIRADIPGETRDEFTVELMSYLIRR